MKYSIKEETYDNNGNAIVKCAHIICPSCGKELIFKLSNLKHYTAIYCNYCKHKIKVEF